MFFVRKTYKAIWTPPPPFLREPPISEQFFHDFLLVQILKTRNLLNFRGEETMLPPTKG